MIVQEFIARLMLLASGLIVGSWVISMVVKNCPTAKEEREHIIGLICLGAVMVFIFALVGLASIAPPEAAMCNNTNANMLRYIVWGGC